MEVAKGNWVGYQTLFYNLKTAKYSQDIHEVIDYSDLEIDMEGLAAYLDFGYSVFGHTPVKHVQYLLPNQVLTYNDGQLRIQDTEDKTLDLLGKTTHQDDVLHKISNAINNWADSFKDDILIPTSGGFDSRLMNVLLKDKKRIHAYTYGTSLNQDESRESIYARELSKRLGTQWKRIPLGKFNGYMDQWYEQFGPAVAASGTYHMEFYNKIKQLEAGNPMHLLSGIIGDAWAGAVKVPMIDSATSYRTLGYTHGMSADSKLAMNVNYINLVEPIFSRQKDHLKSAEYRIITAMRTKMMMLQYLISVPQKLGYLGYSPFLDQDISISMLNLPRDQREDRTWQREFFKNKHLLFEEQKHKYTYQNSLNYYALLNEKMEPLNQQVLKEVINLDYLKWINSKILSIGRKERLFQTLMHTPKVKGVLKLLGAKNDLLEAYFAYITIKPIQTLLERRNASIKQA